MARIRSIKPGFFTNDLLAEVDPLGRILFAGLWCHADRAGRLEDRPRKIKAEVLPYDACDVDGLLTDLVRHGFIERYQIGEMRLIQIVTFNKHQTPNIKEVDSILPPPPRHDTPATPAQYEHSAETVPALHLTDLGTEQLQEQDQEHIQEQEGVQGGTAATPPVSDDAPVRPVARFATKKHEQSFAAFWQAWPKKEARPKALAAWCKIGPDPDTVQSILDAIPRHLAIKDWPREGWRYCPQPATWLNERRWEDELPDVVPRSLVVNGTAIPANSRTARNIRVLDTPWPEHHRQEDR